MQNVKFPSPGNYMQITVLFNSINVAGHAIFGSVWEFSGNPGTVRLHAGNILDLARSIRNTVFIHRMVIFYWNSIQKNPYKRSGSWIFNWADVPGRAARRSKLGTRVPNWELEFPDPPWGTRIWGTGTYGVL